MMACWPCHCRTEQTYFDSDPANKSFPVSPKANPQVSASIDSEAAATKNGSDAAAAENVSEAVTPVQTRVMMMPLRRQSPPPESEPRTRANNPESAPRPAPCWKAKPTGDVSSLTAVTPTSESQPCPKLMQNVLRPMFESLPRPRVLHRQISQRALI